MTIFQMTAEENYPVELVAALPNFCFCDKQYLGTSFDRVRRNLMYSAVVTAVIPDEDGNVEQVNATGQTLWTGLQATPNGNKLDLWDEFVFNTAVKSIDSGEVTFHSAYDPTKLVPAGKGAGGITGVAITGGSGTANGTFPANFIGGTGYNVKATVTYVGGVLTAVNFPAGIGFGYTVGDVLHPGVGSANGYVTVTSVNTGSDGATWGRSVGDTTLVGGDVLAITDPRNGNFWVHLQSCELQLFPAADNYAMTISPLAPPFTVIENKNVDGAPIGVTADWVYFWSSKYNLTFTNKLQIVPSFITADEIAADCLLATYTYDYPDNTYGFRQIVGPDANLYVFGAQRNGVLNYKLWNCVPEVGFTDITPWSGSTGPNTDCAAWAEFGPERAYMIQLPISGDLALISRLLAQDSLSGVDTRFDCTYFNIAGGTFDYHQGFVTRYMDADWAPSTEADGAFLVFDFREFDNDLEASDYLHDVDYTTRRFMFICYASDGAGAYGSRKMAVFVDYKFVSGSAPEVIQVTPETGWDTTYPTYGDTIGQPQVIAGSLPVISYSGDAFYTGYDCSDNGVWDRGDDDVMWLSGDEPRFAKFDAAFAPRYDQILVAWHSAASAASSPFMKLTLGPPGPPGGHLILRTWTATLAGHDFYFLRLGPDATLVYDVYSEEWVEWSDADIDTWRAQTGINWVGGEALAATYGSNIIAGDDTLGLLWFLDPSQPFDESPDPDAEIQQIYFPRIIQGQVVMTGRQVEPCYVVWLTTDMGAPAYAGAGVTLEISDDAGTTYDDMGTVTVTAGEKSPELSWYSLGQIGAPGRLFKITDDGAVARIDSFEMNDPEAK